MINPVMVTINELQTLTFHGLVSIEEGTIDFKELQTVSLPEFDVICELIQLNRYDPPQALWAVYGIQDSIRKIVLYNVSSIYTPASSFIDIFSISPSSFDPVYTLEPWYLPLRWDYDPYNEYLVISFTYNNQYDQPVIVYKVSFNEGLLIE